MELGHLPAQQQVDALQPHDHVVAGAAGAEADALAEGAQSVFVESVFVVLAEAELAELAVAEVLLAAFGVVLVPVAAAGRVALRLGGLDWVGPQVLLEIWVR